MMKQPILIAALTALSISLTAAPAHAQFFQRACPAGACPTASAYSYNRVRIAQNQRVYSPFSYQTAVAPCERVGACAELVNNAPQPCDPVETTVETVQPCEPAQTVQPCEPVQTVEPCEPVAECVNGACPIQTGGLTSECVGGACPIRRVIGGTVDAAQTVAATARFLAAANALRVRYGLAPLQADVGLDAACKGQVGICARRGALIHGAGAAEILAQNTSGFEFAVSQWAASRSGHAELLLNPSFRFAGVAMERDAYGRYWCAMRFR